MASEPKKPRLAEPTARPRPRLPAKGRRCVQQFLIEARQPPTPKLRPLFISRRFLDAFFESEACGTVQISIESGNSFELSKANPRTQQSISFARTAQGIAALLRLTRSLTAIKIHWSAYEVESSIRLMKTWMRIAKELHGQHSLSSIHLKARLRTPFTQFLVDSLPDKLTRVEIYGDLRIATLLVKRTSPLKEVEMGRHYGNKYYADVFRLKCPKLTVWLPGRHPAFPHQLRDWAPLPSNEHLQELHVKMDHETVDVQDALPLLRSINAHFKLTCIKFLTVELSSPLHWSKVLTIKNFARRTAAKMQKAGFGAADGDETTDGTELRIVISDLQGWEVVTEESVAQKFGWTNEGDVRFSGCGTPMPTYSSVHCGVRILFGFYT
ncbi:hypothetical protein M3Y99_01671000 [Aphelenchoides fujianensis]|nr:hypothetical protein M3Y99_01671000 [Aphelenchoides fujianensis]